MASDRSIVVRLTAVVDDFKTKMGQAATAAKQVGDKAAEGGKKATSTLSTVATSARENADAWNTAGAALAAFGGAITAVGIAALKTGIQYNTLQQTTRAALSTLLGSAEAANAQMDKLDAFARTSPFSKQTFITAQQQMLGFGIEAQKVIPYLDAIQNTVAAMGGSNAEVAEISYIMSQISASSKITATDLMQFGQRGVDAASLIGSQMGLTGAQIRQQITAGTLDAETALDALAAGMQETYGGAAANVKDTFAGAIDRVKAAWRDFSSTLAAPLVDPDGGGALVDFLNAVADGMRRIQALPDWAQQLIGGSTIALGAITLLGGAMLLAVPKVVGVYDAFKTLHGIMAAHPAIAAKVSSALGGMVGAGIVVALAAVASGFIDAHARASVAKVSVDDLADALRGAASSSDIAGTALADIFANQNAISALPWVNEVESLEEAISRFATSAQTAIGQNWQDKFERFLGGGSMGRFEEQVTQLDAALAQMVASGNADEAAEMYRRFTEAAVEQGAEIDTLTGYFPEYSAAVDEGTSAQGDQEGATSDATDAIAAQSDALKELIDLQREAAGVVLSERDAIRKYEQALDDATDSIAENGATLDRTTAAGRKNEAALDDIADAGWDLLDSMRANGATQEQLQAQMQRTRDKFIATATSMGMSEDAAEDLADQLGLIPDKVNTTVTADTSTASNKIKTFNAGIGKKTVSLKVGANTFSADSTIARFVNTMTRTRTITLGVQAKTSGTIAKRAAGGGPVFGIGTETSDSNLYALSHNEHVLSAREVHGLGGHAAVERIRAYARTGSPIVQGFAQGGSPGYQARPVVNVAPTLALGAVELTSGTVRALATATAAAAAELADTTARTAVWSSQRHQAATRSTVGVTR